MFSGKEGFTQPSPASLSANLLLAPSRLWTLWESDEIKTPVSEVRRTDETWVRWAHWPRAVRHEPRHPDERNSARP